LRKFSLQLSCQLTSPDYVSVNAVEARFNQGGPFHHKSYNDSVIADSSHEAQSVGFSFEET
jgi:hypothetical protein